MRGHIVKNKDPVSITDVKDLKNALDEKLSITNFTVLNSLPGLPVIDVEMAYLANIGLCSVDRDGRVSELRDPLSGNHLSQTVDSLKPVLSIDKNGREYLRFNNARLFRDNVNASIVGGDNGNTTSFMLVAKTDVLFNQYQFNWEKGSSGSFDSSERLSVHLPWSDSTLYVDHGSAVGGRLQTYQTNTVGNIESYFYERDGSNAKFYRSGAEIGAAAGLTTKLQDNVGRMSIGDGNELGQFANMDFYALFFYSRVLTEEEKQKMFLFSKKLFGV